MWAETLQVRPARRAQNVRLHPFSVTRDDWPALGEEVGLGGEDIELVGEGEVLEVIDEEVGRRWLVHPYRFCVTRPEGMRIDWEHTEMRWIDPKEIGDYETVPKLLETWERVAKL